MVGFLFFSVIFIWKPFCFSLPAQMKTHVLRSDFEDSQENPIEQNFKSCDLPEGWKCTVQLTWPMCSAPPRQGLGAHSISGRLLVPVTHFWEEEAGILCQRQHLPMLCFPRYHPWLEGALRALGWWHGGDQSQMALELFSNLHHSVINY